MNSPGSKLRSLREKLGLTMGDVEAASERLARKHNNEAYLITPGRLSDFETKGAIPSIFRLYSLAIIYRREFGDLLSWFGVDLNQITSDLEVSKPARTHFSEVLPKTGELKNQVRIDPRLDPRRTSTFAPLIEPWGPLSAGYLQHLSKKNYAYGYIGTDDVTMNPILPPGSFIQIDESQKRVLGAGWRSEYERPIYLIQTRDGYVCSWCTHAGDELVILPHPLSPVAPRILGARDADIIGQVVGAGIRLDGSRVAKDPATNREDQ
jgi:transcriptional regulator with XRE-family HTH domain